MAGGFMTSQHDRTFKMDRLYFQFLKPKGIHRDKLFELFDSLYQSGFIQIVPDDAGTNEARYIETEKLTSRQHRDELFKIIQELSHAQS